MNIVSLIPSATEIVAALGLADRLVGLSHECDWPTDLPDMPRLTAPKLDPGAPSVAIDRAVGSLLESALGVYRVDAERLRALAPDIIVTQDQCEVCAVSRGELERALGDWLGERPRLISLSPRKLEDILDDIQRVAALTGVPERGIAVVHDAKRRIDAVRSATADTADSPRVFFLEWIDPPIAGGHWMPELAELAGATAVLGRAGEPSARVTLDAIVATDPDVIVATPCGFGLERTAQEMAVLADDPVFTSLRAVREGRVYLTDGNHYFNRPGPRIVVSLEILAEILHPQIFRPAHRGTAWRPL